MCSTSTTDLFRQAIERHFDVNDAEVPDHRSGGRLSVNPPYIRERQRNLRPVLHSLVHVAQDLKDLEQNS